MVKVMTIDLLISSTYVIKTYGGQFEFTVLLVWKKSFPFMGNRVFFKRFKEKINKWNLIKI